MSRLRHLLVIAACGVCLATHSQAEPPNAIEAEAMAQNAETLSADDLDDPQKSERLAFVETFTARVVERAAVADMMSPTFFFVYAEQHECGGYTTAFESAVPASDIDAKFMFPATFAWDDPTCDFPWDTTMQLGFYLADVVAVWEGIDLTAVDDDYTQFSLMNEGGRDYLLVNIKPSGDSYEIWQIDYRVEFN